MGTGTLSGILNARMPAEDYHAKVLGVASKSGLDRIDRSPMHYREWALSGEPEPTPAMRFGSMFHRFILEPDKAAKMVQMPDFGDCRYKDAKATKKAFEESLPDDAEKVSAADWITLRGMQLAIDSHPIARRLIVGGQAEVSAFSKDPETGIDCKCRMDYWIPDSLRVIVDLKTTADASPGEFAKSVANYRYHVQAAFYLDLMRSIGADPQNFVFVAVEKEPPYAVGVYTLDDAVIERGRTLYRRNMDTLAQCLLLDEWPAYGEDIKTLTLPPWHMKD